MVSAINYLRGNYPNQYQLGSIINDLENELKTKTHDCFSELFSTYSRDQIEFISKAILRGNENYQTIIPYLPKNMHLKYLPKPSPSSS